MSRNKKIILWSAAGGFGLLALILILLATFDWNRAKPWINSRVTQATGRPFAIRGDLSVSWHAAKGSAGDAGDIPSKFGWLPWPRFQARDVTLANPTWSKTGPAMVQVQQISFSVNPLPLLYKKIVIPVLQLDSPSVLLERNREGLNNWTLKPNQPSQWELQLDKLVLSQATVRLIDEVKKTDLTANIATLDTPATADRAADAYRLGWQVSGRFNGEPVRGGGRAGAILSLRDQKIPYPLDADIQIGKTHIKLQGTLGRSPGQPAQLTAVDLQLKLSGVSMAQLYPIIGIVLPETSPYATDGHLTGSFDGQRGNWLYRDFRGKMGSSDISGTLRYEGRPTRPLITGSVVSNYLRFEDLAPLIGGGSTAAKAQRDDKSVQPAGKALPVEPFKTDRWSSIDAEVQITGRKIVRKEELPIENLFTKLHLQDSVVTLAPLNFGVAGGKLNSTLKLDGRVKPIKAQLKMSARHLKLKQLFPTFQPMQTSLGEVNGDASLSATGNSVSALLASSNGEIKAVINQGTISKLLLEQMGLNIGGMVMTQLFGDKQVTMHCMANDFGVTNGVMEARTFIVDTDDAIIHITGNINLAQEQLNLIVYPDTKRLRLFSLRSPLYVTGTFKKPKVQVDKAMLALRAGSAIVLGTLAPVTALLPLVQVGAGENSECARLLAKVQAKPVAPSPGKTATVRPAN